MRLSSEPEFGGATVDSNGTGAAKGSVWAQPGARPPLPGVAVGVRIWGDGGHGLAPSNGHDAGEVVVIILGLGVTWEPHLGVPFFPRM